jgi:hypothetical protein
MLLRQGLLLTLEPGGKAKPLKAAKKDKRELDDEDKAFLEKKRAGMYTLRLRQTQTR